MLKNLIELVLAGGALTALYCAVFRRKAVTDVEDINAEVEQKLKEAALAAQVKQDEENAKILHAGYTAVRDQYLSEHDVPAGDSGSGSGDPSKGH